MTSHALPHAGRAERRDAPSTAEAQVAALVGQVYDGAPAADRRRLLEYLLPRLGVLSLAMVANGLFARMLFRDDASRVCVGLEDVGRVRGHDVSALVERLQQVSTDAVYGLTHIVAASPVMASSAAAAVLVTVLVQRARAQPDDDDGSPGGGLDQPPAPIEAP